MKLITKDGLRRFLYSRYKIGRKKFTNQEGLREYDFSLPLSSSKNGLAAFIRVKNEATVIVGCLKSIYDAFDQIVVVDNNSDDGTVEVVKNFISSFDIDGKMKLVSYPFNIARCGGEHEVTGEYSVCSLSYYYNYAMSHCDLRYLCKWDADMIMSEKHREQFKILKKKVLKEAPSRYLISGPTLYRSLDGQWYQNSDEIYFEPRIFPLSYFCVYSKGKFCERLRTPFREDKYNEFTFFELKDSSVDEFSHWSSLDDLSQSKRKKKEYEIIRSLHKKIVPAVLIKIDDVLASELS